MQQAVSQRRRARTAPKPVVSDEPLLPIGEHVKITAGDHKGENGYTAGTVAGSSPKAFRIRLRRPGGDRIVEIRESSLVKLES